LKHGASVYDAAFVLGDYLHRKPVPLLGRRVVELGCGPGLGAVAAALLGAAEVVATDGDAELLSLATENLDLNVTAVESRNRCSCAQLLWGDKAAASALKPPFDVVLAADCAAVVYEGAFSDLVESLVALSSETSFVLLSYHRRHKAEDSFFLALSQNFDISKCPTSDIHPDFSASEITVFQLRKLPETPYLPRQVMPLVRFSAISVYFRG
jgi:predicted nicotinamide N-methyase